MRKKPNPIIFVLLIAAFALGAAAWWLWGRPPETITVTLAHNLTNPKVVEALQKEVQTFRSLYPAVAVEFRPLTHSSADVAILDNYPTAPQAWTFPLTPWSGTLWVLAAHSAKLETLAKGAPELVAELKAGTLTPDGFVTLLGKAKEWGGAPLTVGNSHLWPFMVWLQAWTAASLGPTAAIRLPDQTSGPYPEFQAPMDELKRWRKLGWFDETVWSLGWAQGLQPLQDGKAVFALLSEPQLSALSVPTRAALIFLPVPHRTQDSPWSLGNAQFLALSATTKHEKEAQLLVHFLSSPGVTDRLSQSTGRPFFAWNAADGKTPVVLADWTSQANTPQFRALGEELAR